VTNPIQADVKLRGATLLDYAFFHEGGRGKGRRTSWLGVRRGIGRSAGIRLRGSRNLRLPALLTALLLALSGVLVGPVTASAAPGDVGVEGPSHTGTGTPTGSKRATSGLWFNDGLWWANLWDTASSDFHIFRFNASTSSWVDTGVATDTRANTHHDVLWDGTTLYVASYRFVNDGLPAEPNFPTTMRRYSYNSSAKTYSLRGGPTNINNHRVEALTIDKDSTGRVWATWQQGNRIYLNVTGTDGATWGTPFPHPAALSNVSVDDTSAVIAFGPGRIGVMWSRQVGDATDGMYWSYHLDTASSNTAWTAPVAAVNGQRSGDDHMNLKWLDSSGGRVFAAIKTSFTSASQPLIQLLALDNTTSAWSAHTIATVAECPNRVIVLIDESTQMLRTFATYPKPSGTTNAGVCTSSGGAIYEKSARLDRIGDLSTATKTARIVDADQYVHNVTSTKQNLNSTARGTANSGLLLLADVNATSRYWHFHDPTVGGGGGGTPPPGDTTAPDTSITSGPPDTTTSTSASFAFTSTEASSTFQCSLDGAQRVACTSPQAYTGLSTGSHTFNVWATDAAGNTDSTPATKTWSVGSGGGTTETVTLTATADSYVSSGATGTNFGTGTVLGVDNSPVEAAYLKFDLSAYAGRTLQSATLQLRSAGSGSTGTQNVKLLATGADENWTETGITYTNRPALGTTSIGRLGPTTTNTNYSVPLTVSGALTGELGGPLTLGLDSSSSDGLDLNSKEAGSTAAPKLVLTISG
jgi:hypothetical protein